jgi:hypothetical protein
MRVVVYSTECRSVTFDGGDIRQKRVKKRVMRGGELFVRQQCDLERSRGLAQFSLPNSFFHSPLLYLRENYFL